MDNYYWNCKNRLGSGKKAIKEGEELPEKYLGDPRLERWIKDGVVSKTKPTPTAKMQSNIDMLKAKNLDLSAKVKVLTEQLDISAKLEDQNKGLSDQNKALTKQLDGLTQAIMANESEISKAISALMEERVGKDDRLEVAQSLKRLRWPQSGGGDEA